MTELDAAETYLSLREIADLTGYSIKTVRRALAAGELEGVQIHERGSWRVPYTSYSSWIGRS